MTVDTGFYVGPIGGLVQLPDVAAPVDVGLSRVGSSGRSLMGRQWRDTLGYTRTWSWKWPDLLPAQLAFVDALATGLVPGPLRLLDPRRPNRLPAQVAAGGSMSRSPAGFALTAGGLGYRSLAVAGPDPETLGPVRVLRGCIEWARNTAGAGTLYPAGLEADGTWRCPLRPEPEPLQLSAWVAGKAGLSVGIEWTEYSRSGVATSYSSSAPGATVALDTGRWQLLTVNVLPVPGSVALMPRLAVGASAPSGSVLTTGWQLAALDAEQPADGLWSGRVPPELTAGWRVGGGAPEVVADPGGSSYRLYGFTDTALTLVET